MRMWGRSQPFCKGWLAILRAVWLLQPQLCSNLPVGVTRTVVFGDRQTQCRAILLFLNPLEYSVTNEI